MRNEVEKNFLRSLAECVAEQRSGELLDVPWLPLEVLDKKPSGSREYLAELELLHHCLIMYLWLSYRFPHVFTSRPLAEHAKGITEEVIEYCLTNFTYIPQMAKGLLGLGGKGAVAKAVGVKVGLELGAEGRDGEKREEEILVELPGEVGEEGYLGTEEVEEGYGRMPMPAGMEEQDKEKAAFWGGVGMDGNQHVTTENAS